PLITLFSDLAAMLGGAVFCNAGLGMDYLAYWDQGTAFITLNDVMQGLMKSMVFAVIITLVGVSNGFSVSGGAEGVGRATTRAVVLAISYIVLADMTFTYFLNR
ncbi:MAG TPA: ABC transporter, partial [Gammaproteobacteria bacterium]|nr:ABC transporter [Gammaproteobacteria bacterium]